MILFLLFKCYLRILKISENYLYLMPLYFSKMEYKPRQGMIATSLLAATVLAYGCVSNPRVIQPVAIHPSVSQLAEISSPPSGFQDFRNDVLKQVRGELNVIFTDPFGRNLIYRGEIESETVEFFADSVEEKLLFRMFLGKYPYYNGGYKAYYDFNGDGTLSGEDVIYVDIHDTMNGKKTYEALSISSNGNFNVARFYDNGLKNSVTSILLAKPIPNAILLHWHSLDSTDWVLQGRASYKSGDFSSSGIYDGRESELVTRISEERKKALADYKSKLEHIIASFGNKPN